MKDINYKLKVAFQNNSECETEWMAAAARCVPNTSELGGRKIEVIKQEIRESVITFRSSIPVCNNVKNVY